MDLIVAADNKWGIGKDGGLLAHIPSDLRYFKEQTMGKVVVMGRKTLETLPGRKGLPGRINYVITTNESFEAEDCLIVHDEYELFDEIAKYEPDQVFLIGGASLYTRFYRYCDRLYVTKIDADLGADAFIPDFDSDDDYQVVSESEPVSENGLTFRFLVYEKKQKSDGLQ